MIDNIGGRLPTRWAWPVRFLVAVLAVAALARMVRRRRRAAAAQESAQLSVLPGCGPSKRDIFDSAERVWERYVGGPDDGAGPAGHHGGAPQQTGAAQAATDEAPVRFSAIDLFAHLLVDGSHITRVSEAVQVTGDLLVNDVTIEVSLERLHKLDELPRSGKIVIPILRRKELSLGSFEARDGEDNKLVLLPQPLIDGLLAWAVEGLFRMVYVAADAEMSTEQNSALYRLLGLLCRTDTIEPADFEDAYTTALTGISPAKHEDAALLRFICMYFARNTVSAVEVAVTDAEQVYVRYRDVTTNGRLTSVHDRYRTRFGIRPYRYRIPISLAFYAHIYDLQVTGPESQFVYRHYLARSGGGDLDEVPPEKLAPQSGMGIRLDRNEGISHTGLHTRGLNHGTAVDLECVAEFEEIPPGALRRTLVISAVCSALMAVFAFAMPNAVDDNRGTDLAALLLTVPGFAATLVGLSTDRIQQSSLTTFGGLLVSGVISLASSVLYVYQSLVWRRSIEVRLSFIELVHLPPGDALWLLLATVSISTTIYLVSQSTYRMSRYLAALRRRRSPAPAGT